MITLQPNAGVITDLDTELLYKVIKYFINIGNFFSILHPKPRSMFNCHVISRGLAIVVPNLKVIDGLYVGCRKFNPGTMTVDSELCEHSWLQTPNGNIIEPYPVGCASITPIIVINSGPLRPYGGGLYLPDPTLTRKISNRKTYRASIVLANILLNQ